MIKAQYWIENDSYAISGDTYSIKEDFKTVPGYKWDPARKVWLLPRVEMALEIIRKHKIPQRVKVLREAFCHEPEEEIYVSEDDIVVIGTEPFVKEALRRSQFCTRCDSHFGRGGRVEVKRLTK